MDFAKKNTKTIAITAGIAAVVAVGVYFVLKRSSKGHHRAPIKLLTESQKKDLYKKVKITYNGRYLAPECIVSLAEAMQKINAVDQAVLKLENRKLRRANMKNPAKYVSLCVDYQTAYVDRMLKTQNEVLKHFNLSEVLWGESYQIFEKHPLLIQCEAQATKNGMELEAENVLTIEQAKAVIKRTPQIVQEENRLISEWRKYFTNPRDLDVVMTNRINDRIFEEFGAEEEDMMRAISIYGPGIMTELKDLS